MRRIVVAVFVLFSISVQVSAQKNTFRHKLPIPDTLTGVHDKKNPHYTIYNLRAHDSITQFFPTGNQTITSGYNRSSFLGPTIIMNNGDSVQVNVKNALNEKTTVHWHGLHLPAEMDGGPHQVINVGAIWQPYWKVKDHAATYWYHSHLMDETEEQVTQGLAGLLIVRDKTESALPLPRTYGVDDIPLILTDRRFDSSNQFVPIQFAGDTEMTNGVFNAEFNVPRQVVRFRILDAAIERIYNIGFKNNDTFWVIASDGGLLNAPVPVTRFLMAPGQRVEILLNLSNRKVNDSLDLIAFNTELDSTQLGGYIGQYPKPDSSFKPPEYDSLERKNFNLLHLTVCSVHGKSKPVTKIPTHLRNENYWQPDKIHNINYEGISLDSMSTNNHELGRRNIFVFSIDSFEYELGKINKYIPLNDTEIWTVYNHTVWNHVFHIHDIQFHILGRSNSVGKPIPLSVSDSGWKDDVNIDRSSSLSFITVFNDYENRTDPFMYHCHMLSHEDAGMMGQFVVTTDSFSFQSLKNGTLLPESAAYMYGSPTSDKIYLQLKDIKSVIADISIVDSDGRIKYMMPFPHAHTGIKISDLKKGSYTIRIIDSHGNRIEKQYTKR